MFVYRHGQCFSENSRKLLCSDLIQCHYDYECPAMYSRCWLSCFDTSVLEIIICNYWSESNSWIYFYIVLNKNWTIYWSEQSCTGLGPEDRWSSWWLFFMSFGFITPKHVLNYLVFQCFLFEIRWRLF